MTAPLVLPAKLDLSAATALAEELRGRLGGDVQVNASAVTHIGALCLQVLIASAAALKSGGHQMTISGASDRIVEQLAHMGFSPESLAEGGA